MKEQDEIKIEKRKSCNFLSIGKCHRRTHQTSFISEHAGQEVHEDSVLPRELEGQGLDGLNDDHLELVRDLAHEGGDLLHQTVDRGLGTCSKFSSFKNQTLFQLNNVSKTMMRTQIRYLYGIKTLAFLRHQKANQSKGATSTSATERTHKREIA